MLFRPAEVTSAFLKMGLMGFAGSGKTYTATETAVGLILHMRELKVDYAKRPIFFCDTETGSDWIKPKIEAAGIDLHTAKTRSFSDLLAAVPEAEANASLLLIDSITHFWTELCSSYMKRKNRNRLQFDDWAYLKGEWRKFTDLFINSNLHIILAGRAGYEYDYFEDDAGKKQLEKTGIKMKAESEMGYEPSLLVLMERATDIESMKIYHDATVLKDRSTLIDGKVFRNPTFESFMPHIKLLNLGGKQMGVDTTRTSEASIPADRREYGPVQRRIAIDEIDDLLTRHGIAGTSADAKKRRVEIVLKHFRTSSRTEIEELMPLSDLRAGYDSLHRELEGVPSRYTAPPPAEPKPEINDSLPEHSAPPAEPQHAPATNVVTRELSREISFDVGDIPASLDRRPRGKSQREKLLADIPKLATMKDCAHWALEVSAKHNLSDEDHAVIGAALHRRQEELKGETKGKKSEPEAVGAGLGE